MSERIVKEIKLDKELFLNIASAAIAFQSRGGLAGRAVTGYRCNYCGGEFVHPDTSTPIFCDVCTKLLSFEIKEMRSTK